MNFDEFKSSSFYKLGTIRYNCLDDTVMEYSPNRPPTYNITEQNFDNFDLLKSNSYYLPENGIFSIATLYRALESKPIIVDKPKFIPTEFRDLLIEQWSEVNSIIQSMMKSYVGESKIIKGFLLISEPGLSVKLHDHAKTSQTITFCYRLSINQNSDSEKSYIEVAHNNYKSIGKSVKVYYPDSDKIMFSLKGDPLHGSVSNEWRFFWAYDFDGLVPVPTDTDFETLESPYFVNDELANIKEDT